MSEITEKIKPLYSELQGYLSQAPDDKTFLGKDERKLWEQVNQVIDELNNISNNLTYNKFRIDPQTREARPGMLAHIFLPAVEYRSKLHGLINYLHEQYFSAEKEPFSGNAQTVITQNQSSNINIAMIVDITSLIERGINNAKDENEKSFLEAVKEKIKTVNNIADVMKQIITTASVFGITVDRLKDLIK